MTLFDRESLKVGDRIQVLIEKVAHGGHFIARHQGAVIFVRHALAGEEVEIEMTSVGSSFNRADVVRVMSASPDRVTAPCRYAHRHGCGGCDFQHIAMSRQLLIKSQVIAEQFERIAKLQVKIEVEQVGEPLGWRTRCAAVTNRDGELGFYKSRSHEVVPVDDCIILSKDINFKELTQRKWKKNQRVEISASSTGEITIATAQDKLGARLEIIEGNQTSHCKVGDQILEVSQKSFWQSHKDAPSVLIDAVLCFAKIAPGDHVFDLYGGVGLFTSAIVDLIGKSGKIDLIEGNKSATADASRNFQSHENVRIYTGDVGKILPKFSKADVVILDPPREGAKADVINKLAALAPRTIVYVACDPGALARDTGYLRDRGFTLKKIRAFDLFPMTHHVECVALFEVDKVS